MISAKFLWGNDLLGGKLQIGAKNSNFEIFESALYMKSVSMPLKKKKKKTVASVTAIKVTNFSQLEVLGGHSIVWLCTHINIRLERGWVN